MDKRRKKHGWPFWFAVALVLTVFYVGSIGPFIWLIGWEHQELPLKQLATCVRPLWPELYWPIFEAESRSKSLCSARVWYVEKCDDALKSTKNFVYRRR